MLFEWFFFVPPFRRCHFFENCIGCCHEAAKKGYNHSHDGSMYVCHINGNIYHQYTINIPPVMLAYVPYIRILWDRNGIRKDEHISIYFPNGGQKLVSQRTAWEFHGERNGNDEKLTGRWTWNAKIWCFWPIGSVCMVYMLTFGVYWW